MNNWIKTAIATGAIALNVVVAQAASAASFTLTVTGDGGSEIIADLEGTEIGTGVEVEKVNSVNWFLGQELMDSWANLSLIRESNYIDFDVLTTSTMFSVYEGDIDSNYDDFDLSIIGFGGINYAWARREFSLFSTSSGWTTGMENETTYMLTTGYQDSEELILRATLHPTPTDIEQVPEPSLILGSILAAAAGVKTLKRGNKQ
jgi:hypothetical protein